MNWAHPVRQAATERHARAARLALALVWMLVAGSAAYWGGNLYFPATRVRSEGTPPARDIDASLPALAKLLGDPPVSVAPASEASPGVSRFQVLGVVASAESGDAGIALIGVDGRAGSAYRVGSTIEGIMTLQAVGPHSVTLAPTSGAPAIVLELPLPTASATGAMQPTAGMPATIGITASPAATPAIDLTAAATTSDTRAPAPPFDLVPVIPSKAQASPRAATPGRRQRLRGLSSAPSETRQAVR